MASLRISPIRQRVYLDTSVLSAHDDGRAPDRRALTVEFFKRLGEFDAFTSRVTIEEIDRTPDPERRRQIAALVDGLVVLDLTPEAEELASRYVELGIFPAVVQEDALHVAIAMLSRQDVLVSWNFKHLVNRRRRAAVESLNLSLGLPTPAIISPPEL